MTVRARAWASAVLLAWVRGCGQMLFCESAAGGALVLLGVLVAAPGAGVASALACLVATLVARARRYPALEWLRGLYGYTGALVGLFWGVLFAQGLATWLTLAAAALLAAPATRLAHRVLTPRNLPALALPALGLAWLAAPALEAAGASERLTAEQVAGWCLVLLGVAVSSRLLGAAALLGGGIGLLWALAVGAAHAPGILSNTVPTTLALGAVLLPWSAGSVAVALGAAVAAGALGWMATPMLGSFGFLVAVAPFNLVTVAVLVALRAPAFRRRIPGRPTPLPLAAVGSPEQARASWLARRRLGELLGAARAVCVLSGAGVSTAAGLPDFRGPAGLWARSRRMTLDEFVRSASVRAAYWREEEAFFRLVERARPAPVHRALAALFERGRLTAIVTQNVDGLHQAAGVPDERVIEIHGRIREARCLDCGHTFERASLAPAPTGAALRSCPECHGLLKGGSVMFGESVDSGRLEAALRALLASDFLLVLGTSLAVAPAADLLRWARDAGIPIAIVNATATPYDHGAAVTVAADVGAVMADAVEELAVLDPADSAGLPAAAG